MTFTVRFRNTSNRPLILGLVQGSAITTDDRGNRYGTGVVRGIGHYGNSIGVPTVGGEVAFDPCYQGNPLVNVMAIGLLEERLLTLASAPGPGNLVVLFGSRTGRDGMGGATRPRRPARAAGRAGRGGSPPRRGHGRWSGGRREHSGDDRATVDVAQPQLGLHRDPMGERGGGDGLVGFNRPNREPAVFDDFAYDERIADRTVSLELFNRRDDYLFRGLADGMPSPLVACLNAGWRGGILGNTPEHRTRGGAAQGQGGAGGGPRGRPRGGLQDVEGIARGTDGARAHGAAAVTAMRTSPPSSTRGSGSRWVASPSRPVRS